MADERNDAERLQHGTVVIFRLLDSFDRALPWFFASVAAVLIVYFGVYRTIIEAAGKETIVNYVVSMGLDVKIAWTLAAGEGAMLVAMRKRWLKERAAKDARIRELEERLDGKVDSSGLTPGGGDAR